MNAQKQAAALFTAIATSNSKKERKELLRNQHLFEAVVNGAERQVTHGEFFGLGHPPFEGVVETKAGLACRDLEGGMLFIPFEAVVVPVAVVPVAVAPVAEAPVAVVVAPVAAPAAAPTLLTTRTTRVAFGEEVVIWNGTFTEKLSVIAPSSGAIIEERFKDGTNKITFVGSIRQTWTI